MGAKMTEFLSKIVSQTLLKLSGLKGWALQKLLSFFAQVGIEWVQEIIRKQKRKAEQEEARQRLDEVVKKPDSSVDEIGEEIAKTINSGK